MSWRYDFYFLQRFNLKVTLISSPANIQRKIEDLVQNATSIVFGDGDNTSPFDVGRPNASKIIFIDLKGLCA